MQSASICGSCSIVPCSRYHGGHPQAVNAVVRIGLPPCHGKQQYAELWRIRLLHGTARLRRASRLVRHGQLPGTAVLEMLVHRSGQRSAHLVCLPPCQRHKLQQCTGMSPIATPCAPYCVRVRRGQHGMAALCRTVRVVLSLHLPWALPVPAVGRTQLRSLQIMWQQMRLALAARKLRSQPHGTGMLVRPTSCRRCCCRWLQWTAARSDDLPAL